MASVTAVAASLIVAATGVFFLVLGSASLLSPSRASRFLLGFARSPSKHYTELTLRFLVGVAFIITASRAGAPVAFALFGWIVIITTAGLLLIPWRWHHHFAKRAVPQAVRLLPLIGVASLALGGLVLMTLFGGAGR